MSCRESENFFFNSFVDEDMWYNERIHEGKGSFIWTERYVNFLVFRCPSNEMNFEKMIRPNFWFYVEPHQVIHHQWENNFFFSIFCYVLFVKRNLILKDITMRILKLLDQRVPLVLLISINTLVAHHSSRLYCSSIQFLTNTFFSFSSALIGSKGFVGS
jgi:hypothetical protein